jgi:hypothetical protein
LGKSDIYGIMVPRAEGKNKKEPDTHKMLRTTDWAD